MENFSGKGQCLTLKFLMMAVLILLVTPEQLRAQDMPTWKGTNPVDGAVVSQILYREGLLSMCLKNADLEQVLNEISEQCNVKVELMQPLEEKISLKFVDLPLDQGLKRLLKNQSYSFIYFKKMDYSQNEYHYPLGKVTLMGKPGSAQKYHRAVSVSDSKEKSAKYFSDQDIGIMLPNIKVLSHLIQNPQLEGRDLNLFAEKINSDLNEVHSQILKAIEESGGKGNVHVEAQEMRFKNTDNLD
ncbi:hypothetical protein [Desulfobacula sp.]|uniref:hypothetical protein n=1 Tax=Desulfobacula sp. TaxID=2593537 RepID=UPI0026056070|nr:hypothetical protein [Desulfobacula sp.]